MKIEDIKVGMKVYAMRKSVFPQSWNEFLGVYPSRVVQIQFIELNPPRLQIGNIGNAFYSFHPDDLEEVILCSKTPPILVKSLKPITIYALHKTGLHPEILEKFVKQAMSLSIKYAWEEIPVVVAQRIAIQAEIPKYLIIYGFIEEIPNNVITKVTVEESTTYFRIDMTLSNGATRCAFSISKDGSGFERWERISSISDLKLTPEGKLYEIE
jgi:hypothetical protein